MKQIISASYELMSAQVASDLLEIMSPHPHPLLSPASGDSPKGLYRELVRLSREGQTNIAAWNYVGLDEWVGLNGSDEGSCRHHLDQDLFQPLSVSPGKIHFFDGRANDLEEECRNTEQFIKDKGGIEVAIVGIGMNGHIGMNEPGVDPGLRSHVTNLDPVTKTVGQKYFSSGQVLDKGITLGIASLMDARYVFLLISGKHKAQIFRKLLESPPDAAFPASLIKKHPGLRVYLDRDAAMK